MADKLNDFNDVLTVSCLMPLLALPVSARDVLTVECDGTRINYKLKDEEEPGLVVNGRHQMTMLRVALTCVLLSSAIAQAAAVEVSPLDCKALRRMGAAAWNDFADIRGAPSKNDEEEYAITAKFQSFGDCHLSDVESGYAKLSCDPPGEADYPPAVLMDAASAVADQISACLQAKPQTSQHRTHNQRNRTTLTWRWKVRILNADRNVPVDVSLYAWIPDVDRKVETHDTTLSMSLDLSRDRAQHKRDQNPDKDPKWQGAGWYQVRNSFFLGPWLEAGPFPARAACEKTLPEARVGVDYLCSEYRSGSRW